MATNAKQVDPLPIGSGGSNTTIKQMNNTNETLTMMIAQNYKDTQFDPLPPKHITEQQVVQQFCSGSQLSTANMLVVIGCLCIVYGVVAK